jgi:chemotaxis protein methyltransferase CheR
VPDDRYSHITFASSLPRREAVFAPAGPAILRPLIGRPAQERTLDAEPELFLNWLLKLGGLAPERYRSGPLHRRLSACLRALRATTCAEARTAIERDPNLATKALDTILIGVSEFFRDRHVFLKLHTTIIPELLSESDSVRIWSAGCSDGSELYSVAFLLAELGALGRADLIGTDCRETATDQARRALFDVNAIEKLPPGYERYLEPVKSGYRVSKAIRDRVRFETQDLFTAPVPHDVDLVLCRNLVIYLNQDVSLLLWKRVTSSLRPDGYLVVGKAEQPGCRGLQRVSPCIYRKLKG